MNRDDVKIGMRVKRIEFDSRRAPLGTIGTVTGRSAINIDRFWVTPDNQDLPAFDWNCSNMEYIGPDLLKIIEADKYKEASQPATAKVPTGRKDDTGKLDMNLLDDMPRALKAVVQVMQWAVEDKKPVPYDRGSWLGVQPDRYRAAIQRHHREANEQSSQMATLDYARFQKDKETNLLHLAHEATSALMALELTLRELEVAK